MNFKSVLVLVLCILLQQQNKDANGGTIRNDPSIKNKFRNFDLPNSFLKEWEKRFQNTVY